MSGDAVYDVEARGDISCGRIKELKGLYHLEARGDL